MPHFKEKYGPCVTEAVETLGKHPRIISGEAHRAGHEQLDQLPNTQAIEAMAQHAITNFLGGSPPEQFIK